MWFPISLASLHHGRIFGNFCDVVIRRTDMSKSRRLEKVSCCSARWCKLLRMRVILKIIVAFHALLKIADWICTLLTLRD